MVRFHLVVPDITVHFKENTQKVIEIFQIVCCASIRLIEEHTGILKTRVHCIVSENMIKNDLLSLSTPLTLAQSKPTQSGSHLE